MKRRTVLAALGTTLTAGCLGDGTQPGNGTETPTAEPDETPTSPGGDTPTDETPPEDYSPTPTDRFDDVGCPSFTETDRTVCWHTRTDSEVSLEPSSEEFETVSGNGTVETITFKLSNDSDRQFSFNPHEWTVYCRNRAEWTRVAPDEWVEPWVHVSPGETYRWVLSRQPHPTPGADGTLYPTVDVESGTHAFTVHGQLGSGDDRESVEFVALFDVVRIHADPGTPTPP